MNINDFHSAEVLLCADSSEGFLGLFDFSIAPTLMYYVYVPLIILLILSAVLIRKKADVVQSSWPLVGVTLSLAGWIVASILTWSAISTAVVHFAWELTYIFEVLLAFSAVYLGYTLYYQKTPPLTIRWTAFILTIPVLLFASTPLLLTHLDAGTCSSAPGPLTLYVIILSITATLFVGFYFVRSTIDIIYAYKNKQKIVVALMEGSLFILLTTFYGMISYSSYLFEQGIENAWQFEILGLVGAFVFLGVLSYSIAQYRAFNLRIASTDFLIVGICIVIFSMLFVRNITTIKYVIVVTAVLVGVIGYTLARSVRRELVTRQKGEQLTRYLANANARLRELDKQKTEFVSVASHQLRGPIAAIKGYASMMTDGSFGPVPEKLQEPVSRILESGKRIALMVDDFLNVTRIEQGRMVYAMEKHDVCSLVMSAIRELPVLGEKKWLTFAFNCEGGHQKPVWVVADEGKLQQVFSNLVDNAIKYTPSGSITLSLRAVPDHHAVLISIKDTGIGIPTGEQEKMFHKFNRASNANTATVYGTGLGLYIAKEIIKAHNGWIHVQSEGEGKGTEFTVELPLAPEETKEATTQKRTNVK